MKSIIAASCLILSMIPTLGACSQKPLPVPVMLTLDTELDGDVAALETLGIDVPATYFITGKFAVAYPAIVDSLARRGNTIGSHSYAHPHLPAISQDSLESEIRMSKSVLEAIAKKPVVWFRAPYMEYDERVMKALKAQGFRYDSSDSEHWEEQAVISELPISDIRRGKMLASDYDLIVEQKMSSKEWEDALKELYRSKSLLGQPAVILLHPKNAAVHPEALGNFIEFVRKEGGRFVTVEQYVAEMEAHRPSRYAVWVDFSEGGATPEYIAANIARTSVTDVFLMAKDRKGTLYYGPKSDGDLFGKTLALLRSRGVAVRVHAWLPGLADAEALKKHHKWAMTAQNGRLSAGWMSPANPEVAAYMQATVTDILKTYGVDGIHLDGLSYPDLDYDYSRESLQAFAAANGLKAVPALNDLLTARYNDWVNWRSTKIGEYAAKVGNAVRKSGKDGVEYSAGLQGGRVFNFNDVKLSGQEIPVLAGSFDFLVPVVGLSGTSEDAELIGRTITSFRMKAGEKPIVMRLMGPVSREHLPSVLEAVSKGGDGMGLASYRAVFGGWRGGCGIDENGLDAVNRLFGGEGLKPFVEPPTEGLTYKGVPVLPGAFGVLLVVVFNMVAMPVFGRRQSEAGEESGALAEGLGGWRGIDSRIRSGELDGPSAEIICGILRSFDARGMHRNRIALVLEAISRSGSPMHSLYDAVPGSREWKSLALKYLHEVCLLGYAEIDDRTVMLTEKGVAMLESACQERFDPEFWSFIEMRLHESLLVQCPECGEENHTHFFWGTYECSGCSAHKTLSESTVLAVNGPDGQAVSGRVSAAV